MDNPKHLDCGLIIIGASSENRKNVKSIEDRLKILESELDERLKAFNVSKVTISRTFIKNNSSSLSLCLKMGNKLELEVIYDVIEDGRRTSKVTNHLHEKTFLKLCSKKNLEILDDAITDYLKQMKMYENYKVKSDLVQIRPLPKPNFEISI